MIHGFAQMRWHKKTIYDASDFGPNSAGQVLCKHAREPIPYLSTKKHPAQFANHHAKKHDEGCDQHLAMAC